MKHTDMADIRRAYERGDGPRHWFDQGTTGFFHSRYPATAFTREDGSFSYFVTSEQYGPGHPRLYTVRVFDWETRSHPQTVGEFQGYASRTAANVAARRLACIAYSVEELKERSSARTADGGDVGDFEAGKALVGK